MCVRKEVKMDKAKTIYCPRCSRRVAEWDGRSTIDVVARCDKCRKRIVYRIASKKTEVKDIPPRNTASGVTFW